MKDTRYLEILFVDEDKYIIYMSYYVGSGYRSNGYLETYSNAYTIGWF